MARVDDFGLRRYIGASSLNREEQKRRFARTQEALTAWQKEGGCGTLGDFYAWLFEEDGGGRAESFSGRPVLEK